MIPQIIHRLYKTKQQQLQTWTSNWKTKILELNCMKNSWNFFEWPIIDDPKRLCVFKSLRWKLIKNTPKKKKQKQIRTTKRTELANQTRAKKSKYTLIGRSFRSICPATPHILQPKTNRNFDFNVPVIKVVRWVLLPH